MSEWNRFGRRPPNAELRRWSRDDPAWARLDAPTRGVIIAHEEGRLTPEFFRELQRLLCVELDLRGCRQRSPSHLRLYPFPVWNRDAVEALTHDCVEYLSLRLSRVYQRTFTSPSVATYLWAQVQRFVCRRQKEADPAGFHIYQNLRVVILQPGFRTWGYEPTRGLSRETLARYVDGEASGDEERGRARESVTGGPPCVQEELVSYLEEHFEWEREAQAAAQQVDAVAQQALLSLITFMSDNGLDTFYPYQLYHVLATTARSYSVHADGLAYLYEGDEAEPAAMKEVTVSLGEEADLDARIGLLETMIWRAPWSIEKRVQVSRLLRSLAAVLRRGEALPSPRELAVSSGVSLIVLSEHWAALSELVARLRPAHLRAR